jgi:PEP-CTERM motif
MVRSNLALAIAASAAMFGGVANAAPVTYSFSTGATAFGGSSVPGGAFVSPSLFNGGASGTFVYDSEALVAQINPDGSAAYRGFSPQSDTGFVSSLTDLSGTVAGRAFSDVSGSTQVGNDNFLFAGPGLPPGDVFQLLFDPALTQTNLRNFTGFDIDGFTLFRVRMLWAEGQSVPGTIPDFLNNQDLLAAPPTFAGRMGLDFHQTGNTSVTSFVLFDNLQVQAATPVPAPETYALLLAGLGLLGFVRRRKS